MFKLIIVAIIILGIAGYLYYEGQGHVLEIESDGKWWFILRQEVNGETVTLNKQGTRNQKYQLEGKVTFIEAELSIDFFGYNPDASYVRVKITHMSRLIFEDSGLRVVYNQAFQTISQTRAQSVSKLLYIKL